MKGKFIGAATGIAVIALVSGAVIMNNVQQSNYMNKHKNDVTIAQNDTSFSGTHLVFELDNQEAF